MKIFSKFNDYYDSAMAYGVDDHVHWVRKTTKFEQEKRFAEGPLKLLIKAPEFKNLSFRDSDILFFTHYVGFCGRIHPYFKIWWLNRQSAKIVRYAYSVDHIVDILNEYDPTGKKAESFKTRKIPSRSILFGSGLTYAKAVRYLSGWPVDYSFSDVFAQLKAPIFTVSGSTVNPRDNVVITLNPPLKDINFQRVVDPFTAYQKIEMFLSGVLGLNDPDTVDIDDKYMVRQKGFDDMSFKKYPTKKKRK